MNCFVAYVNTNDGKPFLLLDSMDGDLIKCRRLDGNSFSVEADENVRNLIAAELEVKHYYGLDTITFSGVWDFLWHRYTGFVYIGLGLRRGWQASAQFLFNRRSLRSQQRLRILRLLVSRRLSGNIEWMTIFGTGDIGLMTSFDIMTELYSVRWIEHPDNKSRRSELEFLLESLLATGDLEKVDIRYRATPKSLVTLEQIDEEDRRHREAWRLQFAIVILTLIIALAAIVQTGLLGLPTMFDFGGK